MNPIVESELEHRNQHFGDRRERKISLGPGTILGIFFALAIVCACFFGFGYSLGRRSAQLATPAVIATPPATASRGALKPAAGTSVPPAPPAADPNLTPSAPSDPASSRVLPSDAIIAGDKPAPAPAASSSPSSPSG